MVKASKKTAWSARKDRPRRRRLGTVPPPGQDRWKTAAGWCPRPL